MNLHFTLLYLLCSINLAPNAQSLKTDSTKSKYIHSLISAQINAWPIPLDSVEIDLQRLIESTYSIKERTKTLALKSYLITVFPDSCGNIVKVSISNQEVNQKFNILDEQILKYIYSLKKLNIFYIDNKRKIQYLPCVLLYFEFDKNGNIINFKK